MKISMPKTLNLHSYRKKLIQLLPNKNIILVIIISTFGVLSGCYCAKGEGALPTKLIECFTEYFSSQNVSSLARYSLLYLTIPTIIFIISFFCGLTPFGFILSFLLPFSIAFINGVISFHYYEEFALKGLAYCVIELYPYITILMLSLIQLSTENISMSKNILIIISGSNRTDNNPFKSYYKSYLKNYIFIPLAVIIKILLDYLFGDLFVF